MIDKIFKNILKNKLAWKGIFLELLVIIIGSILFVSFKYSLLIKIILIIFYIILTIKNKKSLSNEIELSNQYKDRNKTLQSNLNNLFEVADEQDSALRFYENLIKNSLEPILDQLNFLHDPFIRVSIYAHSKEGFILQYRHSDNPEFKKKGRVIYPLKEGVIGEVYHNNKYCIKELPDPKNNETDWITAQMDHEIGKMHTKKSVTNLTMKSRNIFGLPFRYNNQKHMIIVFESINPNQIKEKKILKILKNELGIKLKEDLDMYRDYIGPSTEYTNKLGM